VYILQYVETVTLPATVQKTWSVSGVWKVCLQLDAFPPRTPRDIPRCWRWTVPEHVDTFFVPSPAVWITDLWIQAISGTFQPKLVDTGRFPFSPTFPPTFLYPFPPFLWGILLKRGRQRGLFLKCYFTAIGSSSVKTVADKHRLAAYYNMHW